MDFNGHSAAYTHNNMNQLLSKPPAQQALQKEKCLSEAEKKELGDLNQGLQSLDNLDLKDYCAHK